MNKIYILFGSAQFRIVLFYLLLWNPTAITVVLLKLQLHCPHKCKLNETRQLWVKFWVTHKVSFHHYSAGNTEESGGATQVCHSSIYKCRSDGQQLRRRTPVLYLLSKNCSSGKQKKISRRGIYKNHI